MILGRRLCRIIFHRCFTHFVDFFILGKFDEGDVGLARFLKAMKTEADISPTCDEMPAILGANIVPHANSPLMEQDVPSIDNYKIFTMSDGEQVGVIGIDVMRKTKESSQPDADTILLDEKETAEAQIKELTGLGVNKIILVTHIGFTHDQNWIASLDGVDVVFGGDSHSLLGDDKTGLIASPTGSYATVVEKPNGSKTCVVQAWEYSKAIGNLDVDFDKDGNVLSCAGSPVFPFNPDVVTVRDADSRYDMSAADALAVITSLSESTGGQVKGFTEDADAASDLEAYAMVVDELTKEVVGFASTFIGLKNGGSESGSCDLVAQGFLLGPISNADVSIQNTGGCRASIEDVSFLEL